MLTKETAIDHVTNFIKDCLIYGINIDRAILFGSFAKNKQS